MERTIYQQREQAKPAFFRFEFQIGFQTDLRYEFKGLRSANPAIF